MPRLTQVDAMSMRSSLSLFRASSQAPMASAFQRASMAAESIFRRVVATAARQQASPEASPSTWTAWAEAEAAKHSPPRAAIAPMTAALMLFMQPPYDYLRYITGRAAASAADRLHGEPRHLVLGLLPLGVELRGLAVALVGLLQVAYPLIGDAEVVVGALRLLGAQGQTVFGLLHALLVAVQVDQGRTHVD